MWEVMSRDMGTDLDEHHLRHGGEKRLEFEIEGTKTEAAIYLCSNLWSSSGISRQQGIQLNIPY